MHGNVRLKIIMFNTVLLIQKSLYFKKQKMLIQESTNYLLMEVLVLFQQLLRMHLQPTNQCMVQLVQALLLQHIPLTNLQVLLLLLQMPTKIRPLPKVIWQLLELLLVVQLVMHLVVRILKSKMLTIH